MGYKRYKYTNKRQRLTDFKNMIHVYAVHKKLTKSNDIGRLVVKRQKRLIMQILLQREQCLSDI